jgi:ribosome-associated translation inhibitor RaiA
MTIQVNSDKTVAVDTRTKAYVQGEVDRILKTFTARLTRIEVHLSDVNSRKSGPADKRCVVEARVAGARPLSTSATANAVPAAIGQALRKMQRSLRSFFGRKGWSTASESRARKTAPDKDAAAPRATAEKPVAAGKAAAPAAARKRAAGASEAEAGPTRKSPKKKPIFPARRKAWPAR